LELSEKILEKNHSSCDNITCDIKANEKIGKEIKNVVEELFKNNSLAVGFKDPKALQKNDGFL